MTMTYISGYDGSDGARAALRFTKSLAEAAHAEIIAAAVYPHSPTILAKGASDGPVAELEDEAREQAHVTLATVDLPHVTHVAVGAGSPAEGLQRIAEDQHATLLVVGRTHRGAIGRVVLGSVAEHLLHGAPCPVAVVPEAYRKGALDTVAVAYDGRPESVAALATAEDLARRLGARLVILAVHVPVVSTFAGAGLAYTNAEFDADSQQRLEADVERVVEGISGVEIEARVMSGPAAQTLVDAAAGADLLVMGSRGYGAVRGVLLGSVSRHVVDHPPCPVLVVPRGLEGDVLGHPAAAAAHA